jgi:hypothetical protein
MGRYGFDFAYDTHGLTHGVGPYCGFTTYSDGATDYNIPFVDCNQLYVLDELVTVLGNNVVITGV